MRPKATQQVILFHESDNLLRAVRHGIRSHDVQSRFFQNVFAEVYVRAF
jgi:hypothetical protein